MKKLLIAAAVAVIGIVTNAASLDWSTYGYINDGSADTDWITGGQAYLVQVTDAATFAIANDLTITGGSIVDSTSLDAGSAGGTWNGTDALVDGTAYKFAVIITDQGSSITPPTTGVYGVDDNSGALYNVVWNASTGGGFMPPDTYEGASISTAVAAPEPTSGLLLLLGMAGLALKRKRA